MQETVERADVTRWVARLKKAVREYRGIRFGVVTARALTASLFFLLLALQLYGSTLPPTYDYNPRTPEPPWTAYLRFYADSGKMDGVLIAVFGLAATTWAAQPERRYPILEANALEMPDINPLARALTLPDAEVRALISQKISPLLHRIRADSAACLSPDTRHTLCACLKIENAQMDFDLILAILAMPNQIGDDEAMPYARQLATADFRYNAEERVVVTARHCLKVLHSRHVKERERTTLLRPATGDMPSENLLRPASSSETLPELLLRPAK